MGGKFCFFTDPAKLGAQADADAFGPLPSLAGDDRFRITHRHPTTATGAPAIAICDGMVCAQKDSLGALTLILKPSDTPPFEAPVVSYFLYKGVNSLADHKGGLVFDAGFPADNSVVPKPFTDGDPIERLFDYPNGPPQWAVVTAGEKIGVFLGTSCGLEIVLQRLGYKPTLGFARRPDNIIGVQPLAPTNGGAAWQADDRAWFEHWHAKEQALAYMDPAGYFGAFVQAKLYKSDGIDPDADKVKGKDIYDEILATFANRNVAWLDIRNNYNCSYNLFGLYDDQIRFKSLKGSNPPATTLDFRRDKWPLLKLKVDDVSGIRKRRLHRTLLSLPAGLGKRPAVLLSKGFATRFGTETRRHKMPAVAVETAGFLTPIRLAFPAKDVAGADVFIASYTRINLFEQKPAAGTPATPLSVAGAEYLDGIFRLGDLRLDRNFAGHDLRFDIFSEEILVEFGQVTYAGGVGVAEDDDHIVLFAFPTSFLHKGPGGDRYQAVTGLANRFEDGAGTFRDWLTTAFPTSRFKRTTIDKGTPSEIDVPIARLRAPDDGAQLTDYGRVADYCILFLDKASHADLLAKIDGAVAPTRVWPCFSTVASATLKADPVTHAKYTERMLSATGYRPASAPAKVEKYSLSWSRRTAEYADV